MWSVTLLSAARPLRATQAPLVRVREWITLRMGRSFARENAAFASGCSILAPFERLPCVQDPAGHAPAANGPGKPDESARLACRVEGAERRSAAKPQGLLGWHDRGAGAPGQADFDRLADAVESAVDWQVVEQIIGL